jgi:MFS family permease
MATYGFILGEALLPPAVAAAMGWLDWRSIWACVAAAVALLALPGLFGLARPLIGFAEVDPEASDDARPVRIHSRRQLFVNGAFLRVLCVALVSPFVVTALFLHQGTLAERLGWSMTSVASGFVLFAAMQALSAFAGGRLVDRFSARVLLRFYLLPLGVGVVSLGVLPSELALWVLFAGLGLTAGVNGVVCGAVWVELFGTARLGMIRGVYAALMVVSTAIGPVVTGLLFEREVGILIMGLALSVYVLVVPPLVAPRFASRPPEP